MRLGQTIKVKTEQLFATVKLGAQKNYGGLSEIQRIHYRYHQSLLHHNKNQCDNVDDEMLFVMIPGLTFFTTTFQV